MALCRAYDRVAPTARYCGLLRKYHGAETGVMTIDPQYCQEWAYVPHFYRPFYVYAYATSATAADPQSLARFALGSISVEM